MKRKTHICLFVASRRVHAKIKQYILNFCVNRGDKLLCFYTNIQMWLSKILCFVLWTRSYAKGEQRRNNDTHTFWFNETRFSMLLLSDATLRENSEETARKQRGNSDETTKKQLRNNEETTKKQQRNNENSKETAGKQREQRGNNENSEETVRKQRRKSKETMKTARNQRVNNENSEETTKTARKQRWNNEQPGNSEETMKTARKQQVNNNNNEATARKQRRPRGNSENSKETVRKQRNQRGNNENSEETARKQLGNEGTIVSVCYIILSPRSLSYFCLRPKRVWNANTNVCFLLVSSQKEMAMEQALFSCMVIWWNVLLAKIKSFQKERNGHYQNMKIYKLPEKKSFTK